MMVIGVDPHKGSHTAAAVDELGRKTGQKTVPATRDGLPGPDRLGARPGARAGAAGRWRTSGTWPPGWSGSCSRPGRKSCSCRPG